MAKPHQNISIFIFLVGEWRFPFQTLTSQGKTFRCFRFSPFSPLLMCLSHIFSSVAPKQSKNAKAFSDSTPCWPPLDWEPLERPPSLMWAEHPFPS